MEIKDQIKSVVEKHIPSIQADFRVLENAIQAPVCVEAAFQAAHKLKGASGSIGFAQVSASALKLEQDFADINEETIEVIPEEMSQELSNLRKLVLEISPEKSKLLEKYLD